jgi:hypothetical protein
MNNMAPFTLTLLRYTWTGSSNGGMWGVRLIGPLGDALFGILSG